MTNPLLRLVFGIQVFDTNKSTRLVVSGSVGVTPVPPLTGLRRHDSATFSANYASGEWGVDLDAGDYIIRIETDSWAGSELEINVLLEPSQPDVRFVYWGNLPESSTEGIASWNDTYAIVDPPTTSTIGSPKDPWPPPPPPAKRTAISGTSSATWFASSLDPLWDQSSTDMRSGAPGSGGDPPPRRRE